MCLCLCSIVQAARSHDPNLPKFKWVKAQSGSPLRERVLNVSPLFLQLLESLGFRLRIGRPPHVQTGNPQEYIVLEGTLDLDALASNAQLIEAVISSFSGDDSSGPSGVSGSPLPTAGRQSREGSSVVGGSSASPPRQQISG